MLDQDTLLKFRDALLSSVTQEIEKCKHEMEQGSAAEYEKFRQQLLTKVRQLASIMAKDVKNCKECVRKAVEHAKKQRSHEFEEVAAKMTAQVSGQVDLAIKEVHEHQSAYVTEFVKRSEMKREQNLKEIIQRMARTELRAMVKRGITCFR